MKTRMLVTALLLAACAASDKKADAPKDSDAVVAAIQDSIAKDTTNWELQAHLADELRVKNRLPEATIAAEKAFMLAPSPGTDARLVMAKVYAATEGKSDGAINIVKDLENKKRASGLAVDEVKIAEVYAVLGDTSAVNRWLDRAKAANSPNYAAIQSNRDLKGYLK